MPRSSSGWPKAAGHARARERRPAEKHPLDGSRMATGRAWGCPALDAPQARDEPGDERRLAARRGRVVDRGADHAAPLGPGAVVVADVLETQQLREHEPAV